MTAYYSPDLDRHCLRAIELRRVVVDTEAGRVFSGRTGEELGLCESVRGYRVMTLRADGKRKQVKVHRLVWVAANGPVSDGLLIDHENRIKADCRICNLRLVTPLGNSANRRTYAGAANPSAKLTPEAALAIRARRARRESLGSIAREFGVSKSLVSKITRGELWNQ